jgi:outer membrane protein TolC
LRSGEFVRLLKIFVLTCALALLSGCAFQKYRPAPLSPNATAASLFSRTLTDPGLHEFLQKTGGVSGSSWPLEQWDLADLTLAAFYYNPALEIARARVSEAEAAVVTAGARPNPGIKGDLGGETAHEAPWIAGLGFSLPIETAGKRGHRISAAELLVDVARWNLATTAWVVRAQVRNAFVEYFTAAQNLALLRAEDNLRVEQVKLLEQRFAVGMIPRPEVNTARIQHTQTQLAVQAAEGRVSQSITGLAATIGVPANSLQGVKFVWPGFEHPPSAASLNPATIEQDAVLNRLDVRRAVADYSASEAALRVEIANQYPNLDLGPDYAFEEGTHLFSVAADLVLPVFNHNQGPIREALARRNEMAVQFLSIQAAGIAASEQALTKYTAALNELVQAALLIQQSEAQEQAIEKSLQVGQSDRVALNGAQVETAVTKVAQNDALYGAQQALGDLENAVQRPLMPADIQPLSPQTPALQHAKGSHL